ncbi:MAG: sigma 54-interacting transcriptional regulator, partial [Fibrobacteres bacterium]|nr:sigma 54-interacting transcriptional regulator [Fibrobacterota bacterium]
PLTISITKTGPFLTFTVNDRIVFQFIDEATDNDDLKGFGLRFRGKSKFTSYKVSTRSCGLKKEQLVLNSDTITLTHLPNRKFAIEVIYVEIWDTPGLPEISEAFIVKDVTELKEVEHEKDLFKNRYNALKKQDYHGFVFSNKEIGNIIEQLDNFADSKASILIHGPTGTGKGVLANAIHHRSSRKNGPFIRVDCASIPQSLMERELFGHEKGAFTGAFAQSPGKFESADKGTLFLDEIGNIDPATQAKLLGFLEDHTFCRIGGTTPIKVDVRIIAATNADLSSMMRAKTFREDLYYRLRVFDISLPALRDRKDDIPLLVDHFIKEINRKYKLAVSSIEPETMESLMGNDWPGNVRELYNSILNLALSARQGVISGNASAIKQKESTNHKRVFIPDTVRHDRIIDLAKKNRFISAKDCMHEIKVSLPTVKRDLKALTEKGVLTKQGNGPSVRYKIN